MHNINHPAAHLEMAGELLIRAAAALAQIGEAERATLDARVLRLLEQNVHEALASAAQLSPSVQASLARHGKAPMAFLASNTRA